MSPALPGGWGWCSLGPPAMIRRPLTSKHRFPRHVKDRRAESSVGLETLKALSGGWEGNLAGVQRGILGVLW